MYRLTFRMRPHAEAPIPLSRSIIQLNAMYSSSACPPPNQLYRCMTPQLPALSPLLTDPPDLPSLMFITWPLPHAKITGFDGLARTAAGPTCCDGTPASKRPLQPSPEYMG
jgi:hypothetical protein